MDMHALMRQAQKLQKEREQAKTSFSNVSVEGNAGNGLVAITLSALNEVRVTLDAKLKDEDLALIEDLVCVAFKDALSKLEEERKKHLGKFEF